MGRLGSRRFTQIIRVIAGCNTEPVERGGMTGKAAGHWGTCAEYLHNTVSRLEAVGIHDRNLWRFQALVAERIASSTAPPKPRESLLETSAADEPAAVRLSTSGIRVVKATILD